MTVKVFTLVQNLFVTKGRVNFNDNDNKNYDGHDDGDHVHNDIVDDHDGDEHDDDEVI